MRGGLPRVRRFIMRHATLFLIGLFVASSATRALSATLEGPAMTREQPIAEALLELGTRYQRGGTSPQTGFDCSGLVLHAFRKAWGILLPRLASEQSQAGTPVRKADVEPGDLLFYNTRQRPYSHVGIYVGDGRFVHAPRPGRPVRVESVSSPYWQARFNGARHVAPPISRCDDIDNCSH